MNLRYLRYLARRGAGFIHPGGKSATEQLHRALNLRPDLSVLEFGCGTGASLLELPADLRLRLVGIDVLPEMLGAARTRLLQANRFGQISLVRAQGERLPFASSCFDRVYAESVLGFQSEETVQAMLRQIYAVLRLGGLFVANEAIWRTDVHPDTVAKINRTALADFGLRPASESAWNVADWCGLLGHSGFEVESSALIEPVVEDRSVDQRRLTQDRTLAMWWDGWRYRRRLRRHARDGESLESRLFVAWKR